MPLTDYTVAARPWETIHPYSAPDAAMMDVLRATVLLMKGKMQGTAARTSFDAIIGRAQSPEGMCFEADTVGGIAGWWCHPPQQKPGSDAAILYLHGGWYNWGSAQAFRGLVSQIAANAGVAAFIPDYRLAPECPFPAAPDDVACCHAGLRARGFSRIALVGDSAGGGLVLGLLSRLQVEASPESQPVAAVALSPVTDLTLSAASWTERADADPYFTHPQVVALVSAYLDGKDSSDPLASPLYGELTGLPPVRLHVGSDEVLLDDARGYARRAAQAGVNIRLDVWQGMPHGFLALADRGDAARQALAAIGEFLSGRLSECVQLHRTNEGQA